MAWNPFKKDAAPDAPVVRRPSDVPVVDGIVDVSRIQPAGVPMVPSSFSAEAIEAAAGRLHGAPVDAAGAADAAGVTDAAATEAAGVTDAARPFSAEAIDEAVGRLHGVSAERDAAPETVPEAAPEIATDAAPETATESAPETATSGAPAVVAGGLSAAALMAAAAEADDDDAADAILASGAAPHAESVEVPLAEPVEAHDGAHDEALRQAQGPEAESDEALRQAQGTEDDQAQGTEPQGTAVSHKINPAVPVAAAAAAAVASHDSRDQRDLSPEQARLERERAARREARLAALEPVREDNPLEPEPVAQPVVPAKHVTDRFFGSLGLFVLRLVTAGILFVHGLNGVINNKPVQDVWANTILPMTRYIALALPWLQIALALLLVFGLWTRFAGLVLAGLMGVTLAFVMWGHWSIFESGANGFIGEHELLLAAVGLTFLLVGAGGWSVDYLRRRARIRDALGL